METLHPDGEAIRFGLGAIKNVGAGAVESIIAARNEGGPVHVHLRFLRARRQRSEPASDREPDKAGAMDSLKGSRSQLFAVIDSAMETGQRSQRDKLSGQAGLFAMMGAEEEHVAEQPLPDLPDWTNAEKLANEKELLGFYVTGHPLDSWMDKVSELAKQSSDSLDGLERGADVAVCGMMTGLQRRRNKEGKPWASFQLEDKLGAIECMVFTTQLRAGPPDAR